MKLLISLLVVLFSGFAFAGDSFTYKGVRLGDPLDVVKEKLPTYKCSSSSCDYSMQLCVREIQAERAREACDASASIGGAWIKNGILKIHDGRVGEVILMLQPQLIQAAADAIAQAYGPAASTATKEVKTKSGGVFPSWEKTWRVGEQTLAVRQLFGNLNTSAVIISSTSSKEREEKIRQENAREGAKDF